MTQGFTLCAKTKRSGMPISEDIAARISIIAALLLCFGVSINAEIHGTVGPDYEKEPSADKTELQDRQTLCSSLGAIPAV